MMRGRLRYMGRIIRTRPTTLMAMLSIQSGERLAPPEWVLALCEKTVALLASAPPGSSFLDLRDEGQGTMDTDSKICAFLRVGTG